MRTKIIEVLSGRGDRGNLGKMMIAQLEEHERNHPFQEMGGISYLRSCWTPDTLLVLDLETGEGAMFRPGGCARADLEKHQIWVCPMYEHFLEWLYKQDLSGGIEALPAVVNLETCHFAIYGHRRPGRRGG